MSYRRRAEVSSEERALDLVRLAFRREEGSEVRRRVTRRRVDERTEQGGALRPVLGGQQAPRPCLLACIPTEGPRLLILSPPMVTAWGTPHGVLGPSDEAGKRYTVPHDHPAGPVVREAEDEQP